ncbi:MAG: DEAD/DEAH box helicase family protein [Betaproteobacteria bacterium]|nr:DEAD/DEAH box helicase family protein [Betaproteobacteria bacterium]
MAIRYIYIYETPESKLKGLIKIGDAFDIDARIKQQLNTAAAISADQLSYQLLYKTEAVINDTIEIRDYDIHKALEIKGYTKHQITEGDGLLKSSTEWFNIGIDQAIHLIEELKSGKKAEEIDIERYQDFPMRPEQHKAVEQTKKYFLSNTNDFIEVMWNAKMRFGKTFTTYQLMKSMGFNKILILTYKPAVEDAWQKDLDGHVDFYDYVFLKKDSLKSINYYLNNNKKIVAFASYQDLFGTNGNGNEIKDKHSQLFQTTWDMVVIDEFHYGAGTKKAKQIIEESDVSLKEIKKFNQEFYAEEDDELIDEELSENIDNIVHKSIRSKYRLYLSGTPFKAMADDRFPKDAIFNWTYPDEQKAKEEWYSNNPNVDPLKNPYRKLPQIKLYLYKVSEELIEAGKEENKDEFSLNYFFKAKHKKFINENAVKKWLDLISGRIVEETSLIDEIYQDKREIYYSQYPYDHNCDLAKEIDHSLWYFNRVESAIAMADLIKEHPILSNYHVILVAGKNTKSGVNALPPVEKALNEFDKTITITVGKLTTGVSVPKWKAVLFLRDISSPENYFQTAFRAQTPYEDKLTGKIKETCYIFDFSPNRSLKLLTTYSEKLSSDSLLTTSEQKITEFIRYLPVLKVYGNEMYEMDAREVLTFDLTNTDAKGLGLRFVERSNIVVTTETIDAMNSTVEIKARCAEIFQKIKMFKKYNGASDEELKESDVDLTVLDVNNEKIKKLKTKKTNNDKEDNDFNEETEREKELNKIEKEQKSEREKLRNLLKTLLSRIPLYMYLTDATEENLEQVLASDLLDVFRKTTGITVDDFRYLKDIGLLKIDSIDGYILKFLELENKNFNEHNLHLIGNK